jgi:hypothetical protein
MVLLYRDNAGVGDVSVSLFVYVNDASLSFGFSDDLDAHLVIMFSTLLFLKCFHWISTDRVDYVSHTSCSLDHY